MNSGRKWAAIVLLLIVVAASPAAGRTWYVTADGSGDAPTIQGAIDAASAGDSVVLAPGTYTWTAQGGDHVGLPGPSMLNMRSGVTLKSASGPEVTILDAEGNGRVIRCQSTSSVRIEGLTIRGGNADADGLPGPFSEGVGGGIMCKYGSSIVIANNIVRNNRSKFDGCGIKMSLSDSEIFGNVICWNRGQFAGGGIHVSGGAAEVRGNTVASNMGGGVAFYQATGTFSENLVLDSIDGYDLWCADAGVAVTCNNIWGDPLATTCTLGAGNISEDPLVCITSAEFHVRPGSPCLPENNGCGVLMGVHGVGCAVTEASDAWRPMTTLTIAPNPPTSKATIRYSLAPETRFARLTVYDLAGRLVARILEDAATPREGSIAWDARDGAGAPVGAGVYIVRLETDRTTVARKVVLIR
jgi:hypothetical protein